MSSLEGFIGSTLIDSEDLQLTIMATPLIWSFPEAEF